MYENNKEKEKVTGVIPYMNTGRLGRNAYTIVVTNRRLILAKYSTKLVKEEQKRAKNKSKGGFFSRWKASISSGFSFHERYYEMEPNEILQESKENYEIRPEQVGSIKIKRGNWDPGHEHSKPGKMEIKWSRGKNKFKFDRIDSKKVKEALNPLLGSKMN